MQHHAHTTAETAAETATAIDPSAEVHADSLRQAYNAAFDELGLSWHWDPVTFARLPAEDGQRVRAYLEREQPHLLRAYDAEFLVDAIEAAKSRCHNVMKANAATRH